MTGSGVPTSPLVPWTGLFESSTKPYESPTVPVLKKIRGDKGINRTCSSHLPSLGVRCQDKITTRSYDNELGLCTWSRSLLCWHPHPICDSKCVKMQLLWYCENPQKAILTVNFRGFLLRTPVHTCQCTHLGLVGDVCWYWCTDIGIGSRTKSRYGCNWWVQGGYHDFLRLYGVIPELPFSGVRVVWTSKHREGEIVLQETKWH